MDQCTLALFAAREALEGLGNYHGLVGLMKPYQLQKNQHALDEIRKAIERHEEDYRDQELLEIHRILIYPAECPPIQDSDPVTTRLLKVVIHNWHKRVKVDFDNVERSIQALRSLLDKPADFVRQCKAGEIEHTVEFTSAIEVPVEEVREMVARLRDKQNMDDLEDDAANFIEELAGIKP